MSHVVSRGKGYSSTSPNEHQLVTRERSKTPRNGTARIIICLHGHGSDCGEYQPDGQAALTGPGYHVWRLAEEGYLLVAIDDAGGTAWGNAAAMARLDDAYVYACGLDGGSLRRVALMGWSMGGLSALNWIKRNATKVAGALLWAPCTDLDWANSTSGYTPSYGSVANNGTYTTEIGAAYSPYSSAAGYKVRDEYASWQLGVPIKVIHASDDATIPVAQSQAFVPGVGDSKVTLRTPLPTGGHSGLFAGVPSNEVISFFGGLVWP